jgi:hypothetical protein
MDTTETSELIDHHRRRFLVAAGMTLAAAKFGTIGAAAAQGGGNTKTNTSFGALKQIDAGLLNVGYAEAGPADGPVVILCTAGPTTFTLSSTSRLCWRRRATA